MDTRKHREFLFASHCASGKSASEAARRAGYSVSFARKNAHQLLTRPEVVSALAEARKAIAAKTLYDATQMFDELNEAIAFATKTGNANARVKAVELKGKLHGLLVDRVDQRQVGSFSANIQSVDDEPTDTPVAPGARAAQLPPIAGGDTENDD